jgi:aminotransferase EvaB
VSRIPTFDLAAQLASVRAEVLAAIERVLASGRVILGPEGEEFEREFAATLSPDLHGVGVASGTAALVVALRALGAGPGDEVVTVANTAVPTVSAIREVGATPVFCDVSPETALMNLAQLPALLSPRTRVVLPVHLFGNPVDIDALRVALAGSEVRVLEDCAQAHGASLRGRPVGNGGDACAFSFYPTKNLGAYGDAGLCASRDAAVADSMRSLRSYGLEGGAAVREGWNARLDEVQAAILRAKLPHLSGWVKRRRELAERYEARLPDGVERLRTTPDARHACHLFVVRLRNREAVREVLEARGISTAIHYPTPVHRMPAYAFLGLGEGSLPATERLAGEILTLPLYPELPDAAVDRVCAALADAIA